MKKKQLKAELLFYLEYSISLLQHELSFLHSSHLCLSSFTDRAHDKGVSKEQMCV